MRQKNLILNCMTFTLTKATCHIFNVTVGMMFHFVGVVGKIKSRWKSDCLVQYIEILSCSRTTSKTWHSENNHILHIQSAWIFSTTAKEIVIYLSCGCEFVVCVEYNVIKHRVGESGVRWTIFYLCGKWGISTMKVFKVMSGCFLWSEYIYDKGLL